jgi:hypothetical protein
MIDLYLPIAVLDPRPLAIAGGGLPRHPAVRVDRRDMTISLTGVLDISSFHGVGARRNDDRSTGAVVSYGIVSRFSVKGTVGSELTDRAVDLVEQRLHLRGRPTMLTSFMDALSSK